MTSIQSRLKNIQLLGQSIWYDNIRRAMLNSGELQHLIDQGVMGVTSNPTILEKAIAGSNDYDKSLLTHGTDLEPEEIYEKLVIEDIQRTAEILRPVFIRTAGRDGFVSLEVRPSLAFDTPGTIEEARRLFIALNRPNVMIKVPATHEGILAVRSLVSEGIHVNVTLIFSIAQYEAVAEAYLSGLEDRLLAGKPVKEIASVASFFISRIDSVVDPELDRIGKVNLKGKIGIANAQKAYGLFSSKFGGARWEALERHGANAQRLLWASTGTKSPDYPDTMYVDSLIGPDTVNTVPPATLQAFIDHGTAQRTLGSGLPSAFDDWPMLKNAGIDIDTIGSQLLDEGILSFEKSFENLIKGLIEKQASLRTGKKIMNSSLGSHQSQVDNALAELRRERILPRIWAHDHTVWKSSPQEISNRLGWLHSSEIMAEILTRLRNFVSELREEGFTQALLLGMGGSSLAPEVFRKTFGVARGYLDLAILDSTDPGAVSEWTRQLDLRKTVFIVSTKSGGTVETLSFFKYFYTLVKDKFGKELAGRHFVAITDPGSQLAEMANEYGFRNTFLNDPNIGGRYSALSYFGLVPAALLGIDLGTLLERSQIAAVNCDGSNCPAYGDNLGGSLGAILGELASTGRDKMTLVASPPVASFSDWVEQLIAESTGKEGKGILPVVGEELLPAENYRNDRLFIYLRLADDDTYDRAVDELIDAGHPVVQINLKDKYDLGAQFFLWEMATAVAGHRLGINPFDQPNVESAKILARQMVAAFQSSGKLPLDQPDFQQENLSVYLDRPSALAEFSTPALINEFLDSTQSGAYVAIQAYVQSSPEVDLLLRKVRYQIQTCTHLATTFGYGPRFLHSTGQLHKGDSGNGWFLQITADQVEDITIPDVAGTRSSSISFGVLKLAQALGDRQALMDVQRRVLRIHFRTDLQKGLEEILGVLA